MAGNYYNLNMGVTIGYKSNDKELDGIASEYFNNLESLGFDRAKEILKEKGFCVEIMNKKLHELHYIRRLK